LNKLVSLEISHDIDIGDEFIFDGDEIAAINMFDNE
jgi:hypothetical protein